MSRSIRLCWGVCRLMMGNNPPRRPRRRYLSDSMTAKMCCGKTPTASCRAPPWSAATCDARGQQNDVVKCYVLPSFLATAQRYMQNHSHSSPSTQREACGLHSSPPQPAMAERYWGQAGVSESSTLWGPVTSRGLRISALTTTPRSSQPVCGHRDHPRNSLMPSSTAKFPWTIVCRAYRL
jgi:hypothetical protein